MSNCGYFKIYKGKVSCNHPNEGEMRTKSYGNRLHSRCDWCRKECGGIYPSQLPTANQEDWTQEIIDRDGNIIG